MNMLKLIVSALALGSATPALAAVLRRLERQMPGFDR